MSVFLLFQRAADLLTNILSRTIKQLIGSYGLCSAVVERLALCWKPTATVKENKKPSLIMLSTCRHSYFMRRAFTMSVHIFKSAQFPVSCEIECGEEKKKSKLV